MARLPISFLALTLSLGAGFVVSCGTKQKNADNGNNAPGPAPAATFADIKPILAAKCAPCHVAGGRLANYVDDEAGIVNDKKKIHDAIVATEQGKIMPLQHRAAPLPDAEKATFLAYLTKQTPASGAAAPNYATDIQPITAKYCAPCHADGKRPFKPVIVGHQDALDANAAAIAATVTSANPDGRMPPVDKYLSADEKAKINSFLGYAN